MRRHWLFLLFGAAMSNLTGLVGSCNAQAQIDGTRKVKITNCDDAALAKVAPRAALLDEIWLVGAKNVTGAGLNRLVPAIKLQRFIVSNATFSDADLTLLIRKPRLWMISLNSCPNVTGSFVEYLAGSPRLTYISLHDCPIGVHGIKLLGRMNRLETLMLMKSPLAGETLSALQRLSKLKSLHVQQSEGLRRAELSDMPQLRQLWLSMCPKLDAIDIRGCEQLVSVVLAGNPKLTSKTLQFGPSPQLKILQLHRSTQIDSVQVDLMPALATLSVARTSVADAFLTSLENHPALESLDLSDCESLTAGGLASLPRVPSLMSLTLRGNEFGNDVLAHVGRCGKLRTLDLTDIGMTDAGMRPLADLGELTEIKLNQNPLTGVGLTHLSNLTHLRSLDLSDTQLNDEHLEILSQLPELRFIGLQRTRVSARAVAALHKQLPRCRIVHDRTRLNRPMR